MTEEKKGESYGVIGYGNIGNKHYEQECVLKMICVKTKGGTRASRGPMS